MSNTVAKLDAAYEAMAGQVADLIDRMAENRATLDAVLMTQNEQDTGLTQAPRGLDHWRDVVVQDLPFKP